MAEFTITAPVGAAPAANVPSDVRMVQGLLHNVQPPLRNSISITGRMDAKTVDAIREFQKRFMDAPDGRVNPDGRTLMHLNDGFASRYIGCNAHSRVIIDRDTIDAQKWLDVVNTRLGIRNNADVRQKVINIFHIDILRADHAAQWAKLRHNWLRLRQSFDEQLTFICEKKTNIFLCWVVQGDPIVHLSAQYTKSPPSIRIAKLIHERAHTVLNISHDGMLGAGAVDFGVAPDDPNSVTFDQAVNNAYCYEWLVTAVQPGYSAEAARGEAMSITGSRPKSK